MGRAQGHEEGRGTIPRPSGFHHAQEDILTTKTRTRRSTISARAREWRSLDQVLRSAGLPPHEARGEGIQRTTPTNITIHHDSRKTYIISARELDNLRRLLYYWNDPSYIKSDLRSLRGQPRVITVFTGTTQGPKSPREGRLQDSDDQILEP